MWVCAEEREGERDKGRGEGVTPNFPQPVSATYRCGGNHQIYSLSHTPSCLFPHLAGNAFDKRLGLGLVSVRVASW